MPVKYGKTYYIFTVKFIKVIKISHLAINSTEFL